MKSSQIFLSRQRNLGMMNFSDAQKTSYKKMCVSIGACISNYYSHSIQTSACNPIESILFARPFGQFSSYSFGM